MNTTISDLLQLWEEYGKYYDAQPKSPHTITFKTTEGMLDWLRDVKSNCAEGTCIHMTKNKERVEAVMSKVDEQIGQAVEKLGER